MSHKPMYRHTQTNGTDSITLTTDAGGNKDREFTITFEVIPTSLIPEGGPVCVMLSPRFKCISEL